MARLRGHRPLNVEQPLYVRRAMSTIAGETFAAGDVLPRTTIEAIPFRVLHRMWSAGHVGHEKPDERNGVGRPELVKPPISRVAVTPGETIHVRTPTKRR